MTTSHIGAHGTRTPYRGYLTLLGVALGLLLAALGPLGARAQQLPPPSPNVSVFAIGLDNPRGLKFGPDGNLYVAEGGPGGSSSTVGMCEQVPAPVGPYTGAKTGGRISRISPGGQRATVTDTLPSSQVSPELMSLPSGVGDVAFVGDTLYAVLAGGGCSHGVPDVPNAVVRVNRDGTWNVVADLGAFQKSHPIAQPNPPDFEPDGTWYSLVEMGGDLYSVEPNHGELDKITTSGQISRVADISASQGHVVPTAATFRGDFYVGTLTTFPVHQGVARILKVTPRGEVSVAARGLTAVLGVAYDGQGRLYALETSTADNSGPTPGTGRVVRVTSAGGLEAVASGLTSPTGMTFGPDGQLYVSHLGFGFPPGMGQVVRVNVAQAAPAAAPAPAAPAPAAAPAAPAAPPAQPARPPAQVPGTLPRTGEALPLLLGLLPVGALALLAGLLLRRRPL